MNKICTSIEQSKKLIELGIDTNTADIYWSIDEIPFLPFPVNDTVTDWKYAQENGMLPAWSLSALLSVLPDYTLQTNTDGTVFVVCDSKKPMISDAYSNPIDACYELILKLHELNIIDVEDK